MVPVTMMNVPSLMSAIATTRRNAGVHHEEILQPAFGVYAVVMRQRLLPKPVAELLHIRSL